MEVIDDGDMEDWVKVHNNYRLKQYCLISVLACFGFPTKNLSPVITNIFFLLFQARNRSGQVGYVPEKYLQLPSSNSLLSMLQSLAALDARSHSSSNSTEPETELPTGSVNGDSSGEEQLY